MPKVDVHELLTDRTKYPDDMEIALANGDTISVKDYRDRTMPKADYTKATEGWKRRETELLQGYDNAQRALQQAMEEKQALEARGQQQAPQRPAGALSDDEYIADPILGPMYRRLQEAQERLEAHEKRMAHAETTFMRDKFMGTIGRLKGQDDQLDVDGFLKFSQDHPVVDRSSGVVDLDAAYRLYAHDRLLENARKAGYEAGMEKGKAAASVPRVPFGRRRSPVKPEGLPDSLQSLSDEAVMADPDMQAAMTEDGQ